MCLYCSSLFIASLRVLFDTALFYVCFMCRSPCQRRWPQFSMKHRSHIFRSIQRWSLCIALSATTPSGEELLTPTEEVLHYFISLPVALATVTFLLLQCFFHQCIFLWPRLQKRTFREVKTLVKRTLPGASHVCVCPRLFT